MVGLITKLINHKLTNFFRLNSFVETYYRIKRRKI